MGQVMPFDHLQDSKGLDEAGARLNRLRDGQPGLPAFSTSPGWSRGTRETPLGRALDQATDLAMATFGTTAALVCFSGQPPDGTIPERRLDGSPDSPWHRLVRQTGMLVVKDVRRHPWLAEHPPMLGATPMRFYASAPLQLRGEHRGILAVLSVEPRPFGLDETDRQRLQALADMLLAHWELQLQQDEAARQTALLHNARAEAERLATRYQRLLRQRDDVIRMMDHRIGNGLQMVNDMLCLQSLGIEDRVLAERLAAAAGRIQAVAELHNQLRGNPAGRRLSGHAYLAAMLESFRKLLPPSPRRITLSDGADLPLSGLDAPRLGMVAWELLSNAMRHGAGDVTLDLHRDAATGLLRVTVTDQGDGPDPATFARQDGRETCAGGLALIRLIAGGHAPSIRRGPPSAVSMMLDISPEG